jgi:imidazoleglycerol-phosphate dehydratase
MDDALILVALDVSGRGSLHYDVSFARHFLGELSTECVREFFLALAGHAGLNLHIRQLAGSNDHHICEAVFKGVGLTIHQATRKADRRTVASTKGKLE